MSAILHAPSLRALALVVALALPVPASGPAAAADRTARPLDSLLDEVIGPRAEGGEERSATGSDDPRITIGAVISKSGRFAGLAAHMIRGYELAARRIEELGGIELGNRRLGIELRYRDDEGDREIAKKAARGLIDEGVRFMLGPVSSDLVDAVAEVTEAARVPMVQGGGASLSLYDQGRRHLFGVVSSTDQYLSGVVAMAADRALERGRSPDQLRVAMAFPDDAVGREMRQSVKAQVERWEMQLVHDAVLPSPLQDLSPLLTAVAELEPDLLLLSAYADGATLLVRQMAALRVHVPLVALTHCDGARIERMGPIADYVVCASQWDAYATYEDRWFGSSVDFMVEFKLTHGHPPPYQAAQGAAALLVLVDAIERARSLEPEAVRRALTRTDLETFFGPVRFASTGQNIDKPMLLHQLQGGRYKVVWPAEVAWTRLVYPVPRWEDRQ